MSQHGMEVTTESTRGRDRAFRSNRRSFLATSAAAWKEKAWWSSVGMGVLTIALCAASIDAHGQTTNENRKVAHSEAAAVKYGSIKVDGLNIA
jgi:hypothetical protein